MHMCLTQAMCPSEGFLDETSAGNKLSSSPGHGHFDPDCFLHEETFDDYLDKIASCGHGQFDHETQQYCIYSGKRYDANCLPFVPATSSYTILFKISSNL